MNHSIQHDHGTVEYEDPDQAAIDKEYILVSSNKVVQQAKETRHHQQVGEDALARRDQKQPTEGKHYG
ncbi:hypothetical protein KAM472_23340 [Aeromonas caviae]|uniref:Uncharacterized protein n=1 Tax=Aeromonas caviae TaxID=648 RepID=A0AAI9PB74_AERCA|nr:hypothetical protein KAM348_32220 [Aeromonas caviae]GJA86634.1 hypothetical protein KAM356_26930 [Aeromonas caviae]GJA90709.1 hypothetical protein KAM357_26570 [Aeromonas caviae]GJB08054.1 hypothetical protein KAM361_27270 [Aeromonas caviae]GJB16600.1 hypothetical protein KAM363_26050 [Aeromonas caviae]